MMKALTPSPITHAMNATGPAQIMQRWKTIQYEVVPGLGAELGALTPKLERVVHVLEWARIEELVAASWYGIGRPPHTRAWLANAFSWRRRCWASAPRPA